MPQKPSNKKEALLAQVLEVGSGSVQESAMGGDEAAAPLSVRQKGRPPQGRTIPFTLRLRPEAAELLQRLTSNLQARAIRGELARKDATIAAVVEEALKFYWEKKAGSRQDKI